MRLTYNRIKIALAATLVTMVPSLASAANLESSDFVGISFWLISMALIASTAFFSWRHSALQANGKLR